MRIIDYIVAYTSCQWTDMRDKCFICYIIFTETERRIRANNREYNSQFNYAVRQNASSCITKNIVKS